MPLLEVKDLTKLFHLSGALFAVPGRSRRRVVRAVNGVSLTLDPGETLGLVGESGCGKTTLAHVIMGMTRPTAGQIFFEGQNVTYPSVEKRRELRRFIQIIFQDPFSSLDPRQKVAEIIREPLDIHGIGTKEERKRRVAELLEHTSLPQRYADRYPYELSGGLRQRVGIATALALGPKLIIADEPTAALDASVQAEILNLLVDLQRDMGMAYLFISHNLDAVRYVSRRVAVMYLGKVVEVGPVQRVYQNPQHPYTRALLADIPVPDPEIAPEGAPLTGEVPSLIDMPTGCAFHPRCWLAQDVCRKVLPPLLEYEPGHSAACHVTAAQVGVSMPATLVPDKEVSYG
jgi:oligopeptide/dipeptide ABC transporter ATP-binding protein